MNYFKISQPSDFIHKVIQQLQNIKLNIPNKLIPDICCWFSFPLDFVFSAFL